MKKRKIEPSKRIMCITIHGDPSVEMGSEEQGGQPIYVREVASLLVRDYGYLIDIFTRKKSPGAEEIVSIRDGLRVIRIPAGPEEFVPKGDLYTHLNDFFTNVIRWVESHNLDYSLVHSHYWLSGSVALKLKDAYEIPMVHNFHSLGRVKYEKLGQRREEYADMRLVEEDLILRRANAIIASTPQEIRDILEFYDVNGENIELIRSGVDTERFKPMSRERIEAEIGPRERDVVLFVGRITKAKGLRILIKAFAEMKRKMKKKYELLAIGGDPTGDQHSDLESKEKRYIKSLIHKMNLEEDVTFMGAVDRSNLPYYYSLADVCVVPSLYESFGLVAVEAMACGTPVVASKVGGLSHTVKHGYSGLHFVAGRSDSLARALSGIIENTKKMNEMGVNARELASREFSMQRTAKQIHQLYDELLI
ncbi:MAG: glycosyltransferase [Candidatus Hydrothermarchaeaceae archaeon]